MNKRIKKKKLKKLPINQNRSRLIIYLASINLADTYEDRVRESYLPYNTIPKSTRLRFNKRLCHQIMCKYSKYIIIDLLSSSPIPIWDVKYKDKVRWVFNVEGG